MALTPTTSIPLGFQAPSFTLPDALTGDALNSDELMQGGPSVVVFMCNHCPFVVHIAEELARLGQDYPEQGIGIVGISGVVRGVWVLAPRTASLSRTVPASGTTTGSVLVTATERATGQVWAPPTLTGATSAPRTAMATER